MDPRFNKLSPALEMGPAEDQAYGPHRLISIAASGAEWFHFLFPLLAFALIGLEFFGVIKIMRSDALAWEALASVLFLGSTHVAFTFSAILAMPEFREVAKKEIGIRGATLLGFEFSFWALFSWAISFQWFGLWNGAALLAIIILKGYFAVAHIVWQIYGFGRIYSSKENIGEATQGGRERNLFRALSFIAPIPGIASSLRLAKIGMLQGSVEKIILISSGGAAIFICTLILWGAWREKSRASKKFPFLTRILVFPAGAFSVVAVFCASMFHGMEYLYLNQEMVRSSKRARRGFVILMAIVFLLFLTALCGVRYMALLPFPPEAFGDTPRFIAMGLLLGFSQIHYSLDRILYQLKTRAVRENIAPLLHRL